MDWHGIIGITAGVVGVISIIPYVWDMMRGTTRPNVVTSIVWTLIQMIAVSAQFAAGASWSVILPAAQTFNTLLVVFLCFYGYGYKKYGTLDKSCFGMAILAIILWQVTNSPQVGLAFAVLADFLGTVPTLVKTHLEPKSESLMAWVLAMTASALSIISTTKFDFANLTYPIYFLAVDLSVTFLILKGRVYAKK